MRHKVFLLHGCDLAIRPEIDIYFVTRLLPQGEALRYPLPSRRVDFLQFRMCHCGGVPLMEGCINIALVTDLAIWCPLATILRLAGSSTPHQASGLQVGVLHWLRAGNFFDFAHLYYDRMLAQLYKIQDGLKLFAYA